MHDMIRAVRTSLAPVVVALVVALVVTLGACADNSSQGGARIDQAPVATNDFLPRQQNLTDCVGTVQLPNCGGDNPNKGDAQMYLTFGVMLAGMAFIGWRIVVGLQRREREPLKGPSSTF